MEDGKIEIIQPTLRDRFACAALTGIMANPDRYNIPAGSNMIEFAYNVAERMMKEKHKRDKEDNYGKI